MREYTIKEIKELMSNPYTFKATRHKLYFTIAFKEAFWTSYQAGNAPRKVLSDLGYDLNLFGQKQIDSMVQRLKKEALAGQGFTEGESRPIRAGFKMPSDSRNQARESSTDDRIWNELKYLRQEVEFIKKIIKEKSS